MTFQMTEWKDFAKTLSSKLEMLLIPKELTTVEEFKRALGELMTRYTAPLPSMCQWPNRAHTQNSGGPRNYLASKQRSSGWHEGPMSTGLTLTISSMKSSGKPGINTQPRYCYSGFRNPWLHQFLKKVFDRNWHLPTQPEIE
jgi:hypothetical protein